MAKTRTTTSYAVLGLLALRPWTTYELTKQVQRSLGWFWPRAERKLYDEPKHLVAAGLATATEQRTGNRPRTVYAITDEGRDALREWLGRPSAPPALEFEGMVRVFFADGGTIEQLRATLAEIGAAACERLLALRAFRDANLEGPHEFADRLPINTIAMRFHIDHEQLVADWAAWALSEVEAWRSPVDPGAWDWRSALAD